MMKLIATTLGPSSMGSGGGTELLQNLARVTEQLLYLEVLTQEDWDDNVDQERTDGDVHLRDASWYRTRLSKHFIGFGGGLFLPRNSNVVLYELERPFS